MELIIGRGHADLGRPDGRFHLPEGIKKLRNTDAGHPGFPFHRQETSKSRLALVPVAGNAGLDLELGQGGGPFLDILSFHLVAVFPGFLDVPVLFQGNFKGLLQGYDFDPFPVRGDGGRVSQADSQEQKNDQAL